MNTPPDFSKYTKQLNIEQLKKQGTQALADELSYTRQLYESLDTIFQDSLDGFFITDGEGNVLKVNKSYEEMSGITSEEIIGQNLQPLNRVFSEQGVKLTSPVHLYFHPKAKLSWSSAIPVISK